MTNRTWSRVPIALCLTFAILCTYTMVGLAAPEQGQRKLTGDLTVSGGVLVDGERAVSGVVFFSGSSIATAHDSGAVLSLGNLGRVEYMPESISSTFSFTETGTKGSLDAGRVLVSKPQGATAVLTTAGGSVVADANEAAVFSVSVNDGHTVVVTQAGRVSFHAVSGVKNVAAGETLSVSQQTGDTQPQPNDEEGARAAATVATIIAAAIAAVVIIIAARDGNDNVAPVTPPPVSPAR
ncbi:MAG: hypothetical protein M3R15_18710 [Acidobacteriota bacterium]|nr:hypothetical protein [Acidobacteriota bacterium]